LGDGGTVRKLVVATTAGADDAMPARREKAIFGFFLQGQRERDTDERELTYVLS
jgi:hypothetical protein